jgi:hypothetical protein
VTKTGSPPNREVEWTIITLDGVKHTGYGQTAYKAAQSIGLLLEQVESVTRKED